MHRTLLFDLDMDKIEKIRQEIERRKELLIQNSKLIYDLILEVFIKEYNDLLAFIDTLSECPDKSLDEAAEEYCEKINHRQTTIITDSFKAGAEWQKEQMMKEAKEGYVTLTLTGVPTVAGAIKEEDNIGINDKVKIIIVKEEK